MTSDPRIAALTATARDQQRSLSALAAECLGELAKPQVVEEVLSDAYFRAFSRLQREPSLEVAHMEAWFRKFVVFACLHQRSRRKLLQATEAQLQELESEDDLLDRVSWGGDVDLRKALQGMRAKDRELLELIAAGHSAREVGEKLGMQAEAVRQRKRRLIRVLAKQLRS
jgi:RNA polymerase sigma factor (sigma-70 family)